MVVNIINARVALGRIGDFLSNEDVSQESKGYSSAGVLSTNLALHEKATTMKSGFLAAGVEPGSVELTEATFTWDFGYQEHKMKSSDRAAPMNEDSEPVEAKQFPAESRDTTIAADMRHELDRIPFQLQARFFCPQCLIISHMLAVQKGRYNAQTSTDRCDMFMLEVPECYNPWSKLLSQARI